MSTKKTKKTAKTTKAPAKKTTTAKAATAKPAKVHPLHKKYFHKEQQDFFDQNPSAKPLLIIFLLLAVAAFIYIIQVQGLLLGVSM